MFGKTASKKLVWFASLALVLTTVITACTSTAPSTPQTTAAAKPTAQATVAAQPTAQPTVKPTAQPTVAAQPAADAEWQKVVDAANKEGNVVIYSPSLTGEYGRKLTAAWQAAYPSIKLELLAGTSTQNQEKILSEYRTGKAIADIYDGGFNRQVQQQLTGQGATQKWGDLPSLRDKSVFLTDPLRLDPEGYHIIGWAAVPQYIIVNSDMVSVADEPKSFADLVDPKWKGKTVMFDPTTAGGGVQLLAFWLNDAKVIDMNWLKALAANRPFLTRSNADGSDLVARGQYPLSLFTLGADTGRYIAQGAHIRIPAFALKQGLIGNISHMALMAKAPHPNAARVFFNWLLSKEGADARAEAQGAFSFRKGGADYRPEAIRNNEGIVWLSVDSIDLSSKWVAEGTLNFFKE